MISLRWIVFALGSSAFFLSFFHRVAPAAIAGELTAAFELSGAALGALAATYFYIYAAMQLPTGVLADTLGPRRVLTAGGGIAGIGAILFGLADSATVAAAGRTLAGLGVSVAFVSLLKLNSNWFHERHFATASGLSQVVGISGALAATAPLAWLITLVSWRSVFVAVGIASLAIAALTWWLARDHPDDAAATATVAASPDRWYNGLGEVLRNRATWPCFWVNFGISGSYMSFIGLWAVPFLIATYGVSPVVASRHVSVILLAFSVAVFGIGVLSDRIGRRRPLIITSCLLYCLFWAAWLTGLVAPGMTYLACAAMGFIAPGFTLSWACAKEVNRPRYAGMAISVANTGGFLAAGMLQPLVGWLLDQGMGGTQGLAAFRPGLAALALFAMIGLGGALFMRETRCRNIWSESPRTDSR